MKKQLRFLSALLAPVMAAAVFSGCSQGKPAETAGEDEPLEVSIAMWNFTDPNGNEYGQRVYEKIERDFGIRLKIVPVTMADAFEKLKIMAASDELPDVFVSLGWDDKLEFKKYVDQGLIRDIPKELYGKYEAVSRIMDKYSFETMPDGKYYLLPRDDYVLSDTNGMPVAFFYRKDYAAAVGYTEEQLRAPMTVTQFQEFLLALAQGDPDGNGKKDTYGLSGGSTGTQGLGFFRELVYPMMGWRPWVYEDGGWKYGYTASASKRATRWLHELYTAGALDPEFILHTDTTMRESFCTDEVAVIPYNMNLTNAKYLRESFWEKINPDRPIEDYVGMLPLPTMDDGTRNSSPKSYWSGTCISSKVSDQKLDRILRLFDWLYGEEGLEYGTWGEEGVDFVIKDGVYETLLKDANGDPVTFQRAGTFTLLPNLASWHLAGISDAIDPNVTEWDKAADKLLRETYWPYNYPLDFTKYLFTPKLMEFDIESTVENELVNLIMKSTDFDKDWDAFVAKMYNEYDLAAVEAEVTQAAAEQGVAWTPYK